MSRSHERCFMNSTAKEHGVRTRPCFMKFMGVCFMKIYGSLFHEIVNEGLFHEIYGCLNVSK